MSSTDAVMLGRAIAAARSALGMKRRELAARAGVSYPYLSELENGTKQGSTQKIAQIAEALGMTASQLLGHAEALTADPIGAATGTPFGAGGTGQRTHEPTGGPAPRRATDPQAPAGLAPLGARRMSADELVDSIVAAVRGEVDAWLDSELEPLVRRRLREEASRPD